MIKVGDVVQLKSGGPIMTVSSMFIYTGVTFCLCSWFVGNQSYGTIFSPESLGYVSATVADKV